MEVTLPRALFASRFGLAASVVPSRSPQTCYTYVKFSVDPEGNCSMLGGSPELQVESRMGEAQVVKAGECLIPPVRMNAILKECSDEFIVLTHDKGKLIVKTEHDLYSLQVEGTDEFWTPKDRKSENGGHYVMRSDALSSCFARTMFCCAEDGTRFALDGVKIEAKVPGMEAVFVATDGRRLAACETRWSEIVGKPKDFGSDVLVPSEQLSHLRRVLACDEMAQVAVQINKNDVVFSSDTFMVCVRQIEGRYPRWRDIVVKNRPTESTVEIPAGILAAAVRRAAITSDAESRGVDLAFSMGKLTITNATADVGSSQTEVVVSYVGDDAVITLDSRLLRDQLAVVPPEQVITMAFIDTNVPVRFDMHEGYTGIIMPLGREKS